MSLIADLIIQEKNRRIVKKMFGTDVSTSLPEATTLPTTSLFDQIQLLDTMIAERTSIDKTNSEAIIAELEAIARSL